MQPWITSPGDLAWGPCQNAHFWATPQLSESEPWGPRARNLYLDTLLRWLHRSVRDPVLSGPLWSALLRAHPPGFQKVHWLWCLESLLSRSLSRGPRTCLLAPVLSLAHPWTPAWGGCRLGYRARCSAPCKGVKAGSAAAAPGCSWSAFGSGLLQTPEARGERHVFPSQQTDLGLTAGQPPLHT